MLQDFTALVTSFKVENCQGASEIDPRQADTLEKRILRFLEESRLTDIEKETFRQIMNMVLKIMNMVLTSTTVPLEFLCKAEFIENIR